MDIATRRMTADDLNALKGIDAAPTLNSTADRTADRIEGLASFLGQKAGAGLVAYALATDAMPELLLGYIIGFSVNQDAEIIDLVVRSDYRRQGIGRQLIKGFCDAFGDHVTYLEVARKNRPAYQLYLNMGFVEYGNRKAYYQTANGRDDAILMRKYGSISPDIKLKS
ncbi:MAG: hypothetical protein CBC12_08740 [Candidatus Puniceispirillum sp. TMED52]|nr:hypothetical protein [SAR116 cluster bacterium]OUU48205.1 MAG: hypothetical protein CBC12_08740 [Candidatus Puniceispirillum sp. TMED52]HCP18901.1 hypothetical protein [Alphaproteobacteria bacterium]|tara:strand:+ start:501 stop:1004 length:504 start_codon:yes stop_codon:yes gene_type:complete